ncbi:hypothetical protein Scep_016818 [Stephania cephalantha]|uniref:Uncharacterized protein n=1 Tax=Stephania cephalantha TaxID=152367 RepID=A0AAP0IPB4_9MAGN
MIGGKTVIDRDVGRVDSALLDDDTGHHAWESSAKMSDNSMMGRAGRSGDDHTTTKVDRLQVNHQYE